MIRRMRPISTADGSRALLITPSAMTAFCSSGDSARMRMAAWGSTRLLARNASTAFMSAAARGAGLTLSVESCAARALTATSVAEETRWSKPLEEGFNGSLRRSHGNESLDELLDELLELRRDSDRLRPFPPRPRDAARRREAALSLGPFLLVDRDRPSRLLPAGLAPRSGRAERVSRGDCTSLPLLLPPRPFLESARRGWLRGRPERVSAPCADCLELSRRSRASRSSSPRCLDLDLAIVTHQQLKPCH